MQNTPFHKGWDACKHFQHYQTHGENPYPLNSDDYKEWEKGWSWYITQQIEWEREEALDISDREWHDRQEYCNE